MDKCEFCKIMYEQLQHGGPLVDHLSQKRKDCIFKYYEVKDAVAYCRGFQLCDNHVRTIKWDNKYRLKKGVDIPNTLELIRKPQESDN